MNNIIRLQGGVQLSNEKIKCSEKEVEAPKPFYGGYESPEANEGFGTVPRTYLITMLETNAKFARCAIGRTRDARTA